jgi:DNA-binding protein Fis
VELRYLLHVLRAAGGNRKQAAEILGINRRTLPPDGRPIQLSQ